MMREQIPLKAVFHLPGLFEYYELYKLILDLYRNHGEYFYEWCEIGSVYGAPSDCLWAGGRIVSNSSDVNNVISLMSDYSISPRLTFSNLCIKEEHLSDSYCNHLCSAFEKIHGTDTGVIISSDILLDYLKEKYPSFYYVSSTTKTLTAFNDLIKELSRDEFKYVVPDFRLNKRFSDLESLSQEHRDKVEFLSNECCYFGCSERRKCYENVSLKILGEDCADHLCTAPNSSQGYRFSEAMKNPGFIGIEDIINTYLPLGFSNFKIEGRGLGSALVFEMLLYYLVKPEHQITVREKVYLDSMLDLF